MSLLHRTTDDGKKIKRQIIFAALVFFLIGTFFGIMYLRSRSPEDIPSGAVKYDGVPEAEGDISGGAEAFAEKGITLTGSDRIVINAGEDHAYTDLYNPVENKGMYYLTFELRIYDDNGDHEVLYSSGLVAPGEHIYRIELSRSLEKGIYDGAVHVQPYRMDDEKSPTNNADMKVKIVVV